MIHATAIISPDAVIEEGVTIHPNAIVEAGVRVGNGCTLGRGAVVEACAIIHDSVSVWDYAKVRREAVIEEGVGIGHGSIINMAVRIGRYTRIQNHVSIPTGVCVGPFVFIGPGTKFPNDRHPRAFGPWKTGSTLIEIGASIGANAAVVCGEGAPTIVGAFAMLMAGTTASRSLLPFGLYKGNERCGWVNAAGRTVSRDSSVLPECAILVEGCLNQLMEDRAKASYHVCGDRLKEEHL